MTILEPDRVICYRTCYESLLHLCRSIAASSTPKCEPLDHYRSWVNCVSNLRSGPSFPPGPRGTGDEFVGNVDFRQTRLQSHADQEEKEDLITGYCVSETSGPFYYSIVSCSQCLTQSHHRTLASVRLAPTSCRGACRDLVCMASYACVYLDSQGTSAKMVRVPNKLCNKAR